MTESFSLSACSDSMRSCSDACTGCEQMKGMVNFVLFGVTIMTSRATHLEEVSQLHLEDRDLNPKP
jgi:hypothetical protein